MRKYVVITLANSNICTSFKRALKYLPAQNFIKTMEVALTLRNFSFYTSSETIYIQGTVQVKKPIEGHQNRLAAFDGIKSGSKINLKYSCSDQETINLLVSERLLRIRSKEISLPDDPSRCITFIAESIEKCEI